MGRWLNNLESCPLTFVTPDEEGWNGRTDGARDLG